MTVTPDDHRRAVEIATRAGQLLVKLRRTFEAQNVVPAVVRAEGDRRSHEFIAACLHESHPEDPVLSEESETDDSLRRLASRRVWVVDPLDGTREFGEPGRTDWAVHIALVLDGVAIAGAVALPALDVVFGTSAPMIVPARSQGPARLVISRSRPPVAAGHIAEALGAETREMGSAGAKAMAVVRGDADVYVHSGGQYEWDSAAPVAVAAAVGLHVSRLDGSPLRYNRPDPWLPDVLICRPELAPVVLSAASTPMS